VSDMKYNVGDELKAKTAASYHGRVFVWKIVEVNTSTNGPPQYKLKNENNCFSTFCKWELDAWFRHVSNSDTLIKSSVLKNEDIKIQIR